MKHCCSIAFGTSVEQLATYRLFQINFLFVCSYSNLWVFFPLLAVLVKLFEFFLLEKSGCIHKVVKSLLVAVQGAWKNKGKRSIFDFSAGLEANECCSQYAVKWVPNSLICYSTTEYSRRWNALGYYLGEAAETDVWLLVKHSSCTCKYSKFLLILLTP